jgi:hypothetical protein
MHTKIYELFFVARCTRVRSRERVAKTFRDWSRRFFFEVEKFFRDSQKFREREYQHP